MENIAASFTIFADQPFRIDDLVIHGDEWGQVERIGFRSTRIRTLDGHVLTIPNKELVAQTIHNVGQRPSIRRRFRLGLTYETPPDKIREAIDIVSEILKNHEGMPSDSPPKVEFESFGDYDLRLLIQYYYEPPDFWQAMGFHSKVNLSILERFTQAEINIAYPTQTQLLTTPGQHIGVEISNGAKSDQ